MNTLLRTLNTLNTEDEIFDFLVALHNTSTNQNLRTSHMNMQMLAPTIGMVVGQLATQADGTQQIVDFLDKASFICGSSSRIQKTAVFKSVFTTLACVEPSSIPRVCAHFYAKAWTAHNQQPPPNDAAKAVLHAICSSPFAGWSGIVQEMVDANVEKDLWHQLLDVALADIGFNQKVWETLLAGGVLTQDDAVDFVRSVLDECCAEKRIFDWNKDLSQRIMAATDTTIDTLLDALVDTAAHMSDCENKTAGGLLAALSPQGLEAHQRRTDIRLQPTCGVLLLELFDNPLVATRHVDTLKRIAENIPVDSAPVFHQQVQRNILHHATASENLIGRARKI